MARWRRGRERCACTEGVASWRWGLWQVAAGLVGVGAWLYECGEDWHAREEEAGCRSDSSGLLDVL